MGGGGKGLGDIRCCNKAVLFYLCAVASKPPHPKVSCIKMLDFGCERRPRCRRGGGEERRPGDPRPGEWGEHWGERFAMQILARKMWREPWGAGLGGVKGPPTPSLPTFLTHPPLPPTQDAAGPPGPLCAGPAARLRLAGASVREDPGRAGPSRTSRVVGAPTGTLQARATRPRPRAPLRPHPGQDQGASGGVSARRGGGSASLTGGGGGELLFPSLPSSDAMVFPEWLGGGGEVRGGGGY